MIQTIKRGNIQFIYDIITISMVLKHFTFGFNFKKRFFKITNCRINNK